MALIRTGTVAFTFLGMTVATVNVASGHPPAFVTSRSPCDSCDSTEQWCDSTLARLRDAKVSALRFASFGDFARAENILINGLLQVTPSPAYLRTPGVLSARAIRRGLQIVAQLPPDPRVTTHFLVRYYDFISDTAQRLDLAIYLPYLREGRQADDFEARFVEYAQEQLRVVLYTLAGVDGHRVYPAGTPATFLRATAMAAGFAARDLRESLWSLRYACVVRDLEALEGRLVQFNGGDASYYRDSFDAVNASYYEAKVLADRMRGDYCPAYNWRP